MESLSNSICSSCGHTTQISSVLLIVQSITMRVNVLLYQPNDYYYSAYSGKQEEDRNVDQSLGLGTHFLITKSGASGASLSLSLSIIYKQERSSHRSQWMLLVNSNAVQTKLSKKLMERDQLASNISTGQCTTSDRKRERKRGLLLIGQQL